MLTEHWGWLGAEGEVAFFVSTRFLRQMVPRGTYLAIPEGRWLKSVGWKRLQRSRAAFEIVTVVLVGGLLGSFLGPAQSHGLVYEPPAASTLGFFLGLFGVYAMNIWWLARWASAGIPCEEDAVPEESAAFGWAMSRFRGRLLWGVYCLLCAGAFCCASPTTMWLLLASSALFAAMAAHARRMGLACAPDARVVTLLPCTGASAAVRTLVRVCLTLGACALAGPQLRWL